MLASVIDIRLWLRQDRATPYQERLERDREIGKRLAAGSDVRRVLEWWRALGSAPVSDAGARAARAQGWAGTVLAGAGFALGLSAGGVAFAYDGSHPVNLFTLLGVLVGLPLLLLLASLLLVPGRLPGLSGVRAVLAGTSPGRWLGAWLDESLGVDFFTARYGGRRTVSAFSRWQLLAFSQLFACSFFAAILALGFVLVTFTDLAFGWTTTLDTDAALVHDVFAALALPWRGWLPAAVPDVALVEMSRFFRLEEGTMAASRIARLGGWWPFVLATIGFYGLLPRALMLIVSRWRLAAATRALALHDPEVTALLDRLVSPRISLEGDPQEDAEAQLQPVAAPQSRWLASDVVAIVWNEALSEAAVDAWTERALGGRVRAKLALGVYLPRHAFDATLATLETGTERVLVFTRGWEPPLLEFADFLQRLRRTAGEKCAITVVPVDVTGRRIDAAQRDVWAATLAQLDDSRLYVMQADA